MIEITGVMPLPPAKRDDRPRVVQHEEPGRAHHVDGVAGASTSFIQFDIRPPGTRFTVVVKRVARVGRARHRVAADHRLAVDRRPERAELPGGVGERRGEPGGISSTNDRVSAVSSTTSTTASGWYSWSGSIGGSPVPAVDLRNDKPVSVLSYGRISNPVNVVLVSEPGGTVRSEVTWPTIPAMVRDAAIVSATPRRWSTATGGSASRHWLPWSPGPPGRCSASGIEPGDRVAVWAPNSLEWIVAALGVTTAGGVLVPVNTRFRGAEAAYVLARSRARVLFTVRGFLDTDYPALLASADVELPALEHTVLLSGDAGRDDRRVGRVPRSGARRARRRRRRALASIGPDDPSDVVFTSGTTGSPKGVVMTHGQTLRAYLDWCDWADLRRATATSSRTRSSTSSATRPAAWRR